MRIPIGEEHGWLVDWVFCPECDQATVMVKRYEDWAGAWNVTQSTLAYPRGSVRPKASADVPDDLAADYSEACLVLAHSPKAAAALGRRCLQHLLRDHVGVKPGSLDSEIQQVLDGGTLPSHLADAVDAVRVLGNFAAHPIKSQQSGEVVPVEPGEAEWTLDTVEQLFDFFFVAPAVTQRKRDALNARLADAGKPQLK